eukprot:952366-Pelagomonas_calceolata.AAC.1
MNNQWYYKWLGYWHLAGSEGLNRFITGVLGTWLTPHQSLWPGGEPMSCSRESRALSIISESSTLSAGPD